MKTIPKITAAITLLLPLFLISCAEKKEIAVTVSNETGEVIGSRVIELMASEILAQLGTKGFYITDGEGTEIPSQLTFDSLILFKADVAPGEFKEFVIHASDSVHSYPSTVAGQVYDKRRDDVSYENELVGFRIYGPGTQQAGEKAFGYDLFFKHPTEELIVPQLYAPETDPAVWAKVDSLREIDETLAEDFIKTFSYHIDHGLGMDCYAVGPTLGAGVAAIADADSIHYPWCYDSVEIFDNGPLRFTFQLNFAPVKIGFSDVTEHRLITLDSESHLNSTIVWYEGLSTPQQIVAGFPLRDDTAPLQDADKLLIAYSDPTQGDSNGKALLGIVLEGDEGEIFERDNHILISRYIKPDEVFVYNWGFAWDKADITSMEKWWEYLQKSRLDYSVKVHPARPL